MRRLHSSIYGALVCTGLLCLLLAQPVVHADSVTWLNLSRPERGRLTCAGGLSWHDVESSLPEAWARLRTSRLSQSLSGHVWYSLGKAAKSDMQPALLIDLLLTQNHSEQALDLWTVEGPLRVVTPGRDGPHALVRLGGQLEQINETWRRGVELGYDFPHAQSDSGTIGVQVWLARAYEPAVLSATVAHSASRQSSQGTTISLAAELAINRRLALGTRVAYDWQAERLGPQTALGMYGILQDPDGTGWSMALQFRDSAASVRLSRSIPFP